MFNNVNMEPSATGEKLSSSKSIGFRAGALRKQIDDLYADLLQHDTGLRLSDIIRDGVTAFWPQIEAYLRARQQTKIDPKLLATVTIICGRAIELGVTAEELENHLSALLQQKLLQTAAEA